LSLLLNSALIVGWGLSLALSLGPNTAQGPCWLLVALILLRTQLQTGLFIVAHDAMHGLLIPSRTRWNDAIGALALVLYANLSFAACRRQHQRHHHKPGSFHDPDFPKDPGNGALHWYGQFLTRYLSSGQMLLLLASWGILVLVTMAGAQVPAVEAALRVLLFATLPLLLSSLQLFVFGTYLPHRVQRGPNGRSQPISLNLPPWLSLLACFHFGYHREHHDNPQLSWFELPAARTARTAPVASLQEVSGL
jgi:beta-carotene ketolase (CrtW type)